MRKIQMEGDTNITVQEAFDKLIRIKRAKNLSPDTISHYEIHFRYYLLRFDQ